MADDSGKSEDSFESSVNRHFREITDAVHEMIEENPFLLEFQKKDYRKMLSEARSSVGGGVRDARTAFRESLNSFAEDFRLNAGRHINVDKFFSHFGSNGNNNEKRKK